jgi:lipopolysaccharide/colanic/teichoic acid biosynthesis glycosyltransferase
MESKVMRRAFDILLAIAGLLVLFPLLFVLSLWIKVDSQGPVFYRGWRAGHFGKPFKIFKFRTMTLDPGDQGQAWTKSNDPRITRAGGVLRRYKLDELPQLLNVISGDMSLVGPRPEVLEQVQRYTDEERQLLNVRPGITDWASVKYCEEGDALSNSDDAKSFYDRDIRPDKIRLGLEYVRTNSWRVDVQIIVQTIKRVAMLWRRTELDV